MTYLEIVKSTYEGGSSEQNGINTAKALAPNAEWTEAVGFPYAGTYIGYDEIFKNVFYKLGTEWTNYKLSIEDYVASGNKVVAYGTYSGIYNKTGKFMSARVAHLWEFKNDKAIRFEQFVDSKTVVDAMQK
ncbi:nuclear transport factor 2 family protein [Flavobacterium sp. '19STA2R22 D10 B1']|uniref:nuclear transport factor 2 family protein n=1 Tax=Flavobacterium aerium TaxID=3037261 RepID=UPI00278BCA0D|nr:nuclear transport factor 2 family protein [Flavobacterium sp. '19STA2R22 D10 B1']